MNSKSVLSLILVLGASLSAPSLAQQPDRTIDSLTRSSHIIFLGHVVKLRATNVEVLIAPEKTAVVRVEELFDAPPGVAGLKGQDVTVVMLRPEGWKPEQQAVFFTNGVIFGQHLTVKEVGQLPAPSDRAQLKAQIVAIRAKMADETLQSRIAGAALVIAGKVLSVKEVQRIGPLSEHQADWAIAVVQIVSIEKGSFDGKTLNVYFPQSKDERWLLSPKFQVGQQGIWLLRRESNLGLPEAALTALDSLDFQPLAEKEKVRRLAH